MNKKLVVNYFQFSSKSILINWDNSINNHILFDVLSFMQAIKLSDKSILEVRNTYCSLLVSYTFTIDNIYSEINSLNLIYLHKKKYNISEKKIWKIPVCYNEYFGKDLVNISKNIKLNVEEIIKLHNENTYTVCFLGFLPGFLYLSNLNKKLYFPRKSDPDLNIIKGSVGIGGSQTGVYPSNSPGGWNIIGNSPIDFIGGDFNDKISFATPGDLIKFIPISQDDHKHILNNLGSYKIDSEVFNG